MKSLLNLVEELLRGLAEEEDGAQVIEYALIIAVVSIALVIFLGSATAGFDFTAFVGRVGTCLTTVSCV